MTAECRPEEGTKDGTYHNLLEPNGYPSVWWWKEEGWHKSPFSKSSGTPREFAANSFTYLGPVTMPPRNLTREEMMEIAREAYLDPDATSTAWGLALTRITRGTAE